MFPIINEDWEFVGSCQSSYTSSDCPEFISAFTATATNRHGVTAPVGIDIHTTYKSTSRYN